MKKIFILVHISIVCCSCSLMGNITTYNNDGSVRKVYKNVVINNAMKPFGVNFYDKYSNKHIIISNSTEYTIEYNSYTTSSENLNSDDNKLLEQKAKLKYELVYYMTLRDKYEYGSDEYDKYNKVVKDIKSKIKSINNSLYFTL